MKYQKLLSPGRIGTLELKNRAIMAPMSAALANPDGTISDPLIAYLKARADGGIGLIITEYTYIDANDQPNPRMIGMYDDSFISEWKEIIDYAHFKNVKIACQIAMGG